VKKTNKLDVLLIILLICCGLKLTFHIDRLIDIALYDETGYIQRALSIPASGMPSASISPLYSIWYYFLSAFVNKPLDLFYLNIILQIILLPIIFFIFLRTLRINPLYSLLSAFYLLISYGNIFPMPRSALFVTLIIMTFFIFFALAKNDFIKIMILASGCLVASFIRPEYFLGFVAFIMYAIVLFVLRKESTRFFLTTIFSFSLLWVALISWAGNPFTDGYATRGFWAFGQNFSYNYATWEKLNINPWTNSDKIIEQHFGNSHNLFLAFLTNPVLILKHFFSNLLLYFKYIYLILFVHLNIILPSSQRIFSFIESLMVVGFICYLMARNRIRYAQNCQ